MHRPHHGPRPSSRRRWRPPTAALALALTAAVLAPPAPADAQSPTNTYGYLELPPADRIHFEPTGAGTVLPGGGRYATTRSPSVLLWSAGAAVMTLEPTTPRNHLVVHARADVCEGFPRMVVELDGVIVLDELVGTSWIDSRFTVPDAATAGRREVRIRFPNPHRTDDCDRNLKIGGVELTEWDPGPDSTTLVGTDFTVPDGTGGVFHHSFQGLPALGLWQDATATAQVPTPDVTHLRVGARGDACEGDPRMHVRVDGELVLDTEVTTERRLVRRSRQAVLGTYTAAGTWPAGVRDVHVSFVNDHRTGDCDRNLKVEYVQFTSTEWRHPDADAPTWYTAERLDWTFDPVSSGSAPAPGDWGGHTLVDAGGSATTDVVFPRRVSSFTLHAAAEGCSARTVLVRVLVDGEEVLVAPVVDLIEGAMFVVPGPWEAGTHRLRIEFPDPEPDPRCERRLQVRELALGDDAPAFLVVPEDLIVLNGIAERPAGGPFTVALPAILRASTASTEVAAVAVRARAQDCGAPVRMQIRVQGRVVLEEEVVSGTSSLTGTPFLGEHRATGPWPAGWREVDLYVDGGGEAPGCDPTVVIENLRMELVAPDMG
jgi:hypothetical protein